MIVAIPPTLAARIDYHPALPAARDQLTQRLGQGTLTKVTVVYPTPFWRAKGLSGTATSADGLVSATFDDTPERGTRASCSGSSAATRPACTKAFTPTRGGPRC